MMTSIKKKRNRKRFEVNINKGIFNFIIIFILVIIILPKVNENRIIQSGLYSITAKFKKSDSNNQRILNCGGFNFDNLLTFPDKIRINNGIEEDYNDDDSYNLLEEENIVEYFWENESITSCEGMFYGCNNLIEIDFSNFNTSNVISTYSMFDDCINLKSLNLSNFDTSKVESMDLMFDGCDSLTSLNLFKFNISKEVSISEIFFECTELSFINFSSATIENEDIIYELDEISSKKLLIILNDEILEFFYSLTNTLDFSYKLEIPEKEVILNSTSLIEDYSTYYIKGDLGCIKI